MTLTDKLFTGQRSDATGLEFYNARYYDAGLGKFTSADNVSPQSANPQAFNRYTYVINNPLRYVDLTGHKLEIDSEGGGPVEPDLSPDDQMALDAAGISTSSWTSGQFYNFDYSDWTPDKVDNQDTAAPPLLGVQANPSKNNSDGGQASIPEIITEGGVGLLGMVVGGVMIIYGGAQVVAGGVRVAKGDPSGYEQIHAGLHIANGGVWAGFAGYKLVEDAAVKGFDRYRCSIPFVGC